MAFEFVDETPAPASGFEFVDGGDSIPASDESILARVGDVNYVPTLAEYKLYKQAKERRPFSVGRTVETALSAGRQVVSDIGQAAGKVFSGEALAHPLDTAQSGVEAVARNLFDQGMLFRKMGAVTRDGSPALAIPFTDQVPNEAQFLASKVAQLNQKEFQGQMVTDIKQLWGVGKPVPEELLAQWKTDYKDYVDQVQYQEFLHERGLERFREKARTGENTLVPEVIGKTDTQLAEAGSYVADPTLVLPGAAAAKGAGLTERLLAKGATGTGRALESAGNITSKIATIPERVAGAVTQAVTDSAEQAAKVEKAVGNGAIVTLAAAPGVYVPGVTETAAAITSGKATGAGLKQAGQAGQSVGRALPEVSDRYGIFATIAADGSAPSWLRKSAGMLTNLDPVAANAGTALKGAAEGSAIGATLGGLADGEEGFASGLGSGGVLGAAGALAGRALSARERLRRAEEADVTRWLAGKSPEEIANIKTTIRSHEDAVKMADVERLAQGLRGAAGEGDVAFVYLNSKEIAARFGADAKFSGVQIMAADTPTVVVNTDYHGPRPLAHEVFHALMRLDGMSGEKSKIFNSLFDEHLPDGTRLNEGIYTQADLAEFEKQYRNRLTQQQKAEWLTRATTPEGQSENLRRVKEEIAAEHFANLIDGSGTSLLSRDASSTRTRLADALLLANSTSRLGRMRQMLERVGVKFSADGTPSELFVKDGKPVTNSAQINAALRDFIRAKQRISKRLIGGDEESGVRIPAEVISGNRARAIAKVFKGTDLFKEVNGRPMLRTDKEIKQMQQRRVESMIAQLDSAPSSTDAGAVRKLENGSYSGRYFSDGQLEKLLSLPDDVLSPSMKDRLRQFNEAVRRGDGSHLLIDYYAALRNGKYSSGISMATRTAVPFEIQISKAGNFNLVTLDTTHFSAKLDRWMTGKRELFKPWGNERDAFIRDVFTYLDNHANGRPGGVNLDVDPARAAEKKNIINEFFNMPQRADANPLRFNVKGIKDNLIRSRRFDRTSRVVELPDKFPFTKSTYELQKANFLPPRVGISLREVGADFPVDHVRPTLLDTSGNNAQVTQRAAEKFQQWPVTVRAADGSEILLRNPEGGSIAARVRHLLFDHENQRLNALKAKWMPMVPETLVNAAGRLVDHRSGNRIFVRAYEGGEKHMVVVSPKGEVVAQKPFRGALITQFQDVPPSVQGRMRFDWVREGMGSGQSQGTPSPTPIDSTRPDARQPEFRPHHSFLPENVKPTAAEVLRQAHAQAAEDFAARIPMLPTPVGREMGTRFYAAVSKHLNLNARIPGERTQLISRFADQLPESFFKSLNEKLVKSGLNGVREAVDLEAKQFADRWKSRHS